MDKFIRVNQGTEQHAILCQAWRDACRKAKIPYVVIFVSEAKISVGASVLHLLTLPRSIASVNTKAIAGQLNELFSHYAGNIKNYWNFNDLYHLYDFVPEEEVTTLAEKVFDIIKANIVFNNEI